MGKTRNLNGDDVTEEPTQHNRTEMSRRKRCFAPLL